MKDLAEKYDRLAPGFAESSYANLEWDMRRRLVLALNWGPKLVPGNSILELGSGDGYLATKLVQSGLTYQGIDISPGMIQAAEQRLGKELDQGDYTFQVANVSDIMLAAPIDCLVSYMRAFFTYVDDPLRFLTEIRPKIKKKLIVDINPRGPIPVLEGITILESAGYLRIRWRPFLVPKSKRLPRSVLLVLSYLEQVPLIRNLATRRKFHCLLLGEV